jgi:hypothetical protein
MKTHTLWCRSAYEANTDPQRRCYNGALVSSELRWTEWSELEFVTSDQAEPRIKFWQELNDYAASQRGKFAKRDFRVTRIYPDIQILIPNESLS